MKIKLWKLFKKSEASFTKQLRLNKGTSLIQLKQWSGLLHTSRAPSGVKCSKYIGTLLISGKVWGKNTKNPTFFFFLNQPVFLIETISHSIKQKKKMKNFTDKNLTSAPCSYFDSLDRFAFEKAAFFFFK